MKANNSFINDITFRLATKVKSISADDCHIIKDEIEKSINSLISIPEYARRNKIAKQTAYNRLERRKIPMIDISKCIFTINDKLKDMYRSQLKQRIIEHCQNADNILDVCMLAEVDRKDFYFEYSRDAEFAADVDRLMGWDVHGCCKRYHDRMKREDDPTELLREFAAYLKKVKNRCYESSLDNFLALKQEGKSIADIKNYL